MPAEQAPILGDWDRPPEPVAAPVGDVVHLWRVQLAGQNEDYWRALLTDEEQQRASRFRVAADRHRFTVTRGILRAALGQYLGAAAESLRLEYGRSGKPALVAAQNPAGITFNVAHSGGLSLLAFGLAVHLGVDVERIRPETNIDDIARTVFSPAQCDDLLALPDAARCVAFFQAWTRKEAVAKALGSGLSSFLDPSQVAGAEAAPWCVRNVEVGEGYAAAIAVGARDLELRLWEWIPACRRP